ncbi:hypothetical protein Tco_1218991 [Tanacetum coccineum]
MCGGLCRPSGIIVIMEYLVNISKRRAFWSLNEDILKITILTTNTSYPSRKIRRIRACTHQRPQRKQAQYAVSREDQYAVLEIYANKKKDVKPTIEVNNSNPFDVLNSLENDVDLGTNGETSNMASKKVNSSGSLFWNVESSSMSTTPLVEKIDKIERLIDGKVTLVDDEGKPLTKVDSSGDHDNEDEVASVDNDMVNFLASKKVGYCTNSLLEQWKESYVTRFKLYAIIWISKFEVVRRNSYYCFFCSLVTLCTLLSGSSFAYVTGGDMRLTLILYT